MIPIDQIKRAGEVRALKDAIEGCIKELMNNWEGMYQDRKFKNLDDKMHKAGIILANMRDLFEALKELEPSNK
jgi:hypothetical protein